MRDFVEVYLYLLEKENRKYFIFTQQHKVVFMRIAYVTVGTLKLTASPRRVSVLSTCNFENYLDKKSCIVFNVYAFH